MNKEMDFFLFGLNKVPLSDFYEGHTDEKHGCKDQDSKLSENTGSKTRG
jgi:hypothetical protein